MWGRIVTAVERAEEWLWKRFPSRSWEERVPDHKGAPLTREEKALVSTVLVYPFLLLGLGVGLTLLLELPALYPLKGAISAGISWGLIVTGTAYGVWTLLYPHHRIDPKMDVPAVVLGWLVGTLWIWMGALRLPGYGVGIGIPLSGLLLLLFLAKRSLRRRRGHAAGRGGSLPSGL